MKCTFVAIGAENVSLETLSAMLKRHGHETNLAYDQALFDDKNYLSMPRIAKLFDHKRTVLKQIADSKPDLVAFSVMTPTYQWAADMARRVKEIMDVPIIFGGIHPTTLPEQTINNEYVDMICVGEGDDAILELGNAISRKKLDYSIKNLWFKTSDGIIRNPERPLINDLDSLPMPDKELFEKHLPLKNYYLAVTARGCPFACSYCSLNFMAKKAEQLGGQRLRERSVNSVMQELLSMHQKYGFDWIDFRNNTFTARRSWLLEFLDRYKREMGLPFRAFGHPATIDNEIALKLKEANCFAIQLGVESFSAEVRKTILHRNESNLQIMSAVEAMDRTGLPYSLDYILGLPTQNEDELHAAAQFFIERKACFRVSSFMLEYLPRLDIIQHGLKHGELTKADIVAIENGQHGHYVATGSVGKNPKKLRYFMAYRLLFRMIPLVPKSFSRWILHKQIYKIFPRLPLDVFLTFIDIIMVFRRSDKDATTYAKNYGYLFISRFKRNNPAYWRR